MKLRAGQTLLHYRIVEKIGEGGMGEVWKALDTTLDREVAIKQIAEPFVADGERLARFVREAKLLAALNHPNIAAVYGLHEADGAHFIAMELVPGEDLAQRLARGALAVDDALDVARQVAGALEAAHEQGVIHRDLKPANVKRTPDGTIKVLDLGLAKALAPETSGDPASASLSPTVTSAGTVAGTLLGTAAYMSPEQAKGRPCDRRADIWAFGVVLHEMLTGRRLFHADTISETLAGVLRDDLSMDDLPASVPPSVKQLIERCLERDPKMRLRDIGEARIALAPERLAAAPAGTGKPAPGTSARKASPLPWILVAVLAFVAAFALWRGSGGPARPGAGLMLTAAIPAELRIPVDQRGVMAVSPDGMTLALALIDTDNQKLLYVRKLDSPELTPVPGTDDASSPFFSPDGRWIGFFAGEKLKKLPVDGGSPVTICDAPGVDRGATWGTDDVIVFAPHYVRPLMRVPGAGGEATALTEIDGAAGERTHRWPQAVPGEDLVLFTVGTIDRPESYDDARIVAIRPSSGEQTTVLERASMARYVPTGHLVYGREGFLFAVPFDVDTLEVHGSPVPVLEGVLGMAASGVVHFDVSENGLLTYLPGSSMARENRLVLHRRDGTVTPLAAPLQGYLQPRVSPDRKRVVVQYVPGPTFDLGVYDIERETFTRLTFDGDNTLPVWSRDGTRIAFASVRGEASMSAWITAADGSGQADEVCVPGRFGSDATMVVPGDWTPDDRSLLVRFSNPNAGNLGTCSLESDDVEVLLETPAAEINPTLSPNGRWLAYSSDESGTFQVFVRAFRGPGGKWQISTDGGSLSRWSHDGTELFYRWRSQLLSVRIDDSDGSFKAGRPQVVLDNLRGTTGTFYYDVFDGDRFLYIEDADPEAPTPGVTVVVNWLDELERKVPR